eukprot:TRINITY_DN124_c0_g1_i4.p2 TRINITY_DN124_c0_g1~~TRINITY_DN124_c0_g1_i4.p2  ORF type:complete len:352 (+),score=161.91 TRINITY_DN124_c0_g1_i4:58-1056(+)
MKTMLASLAALHCAATASAMSEHEVSFKLYKQHFGKVYKDAAEEAHRFEAFKASLAYIAGSGSPASGLTQFSDMTQAEFKSQYANRHTQKAGAAVRRWDGTCYSCKRFPELATKNFTDFDWTTYGAVTTVKNQGMCGSCWSFGTTGDIEGTWFLAGNSLTPLSEQQLVSCDKVDEGCNGGMQEDAFDWVIKNHGIAAEAAYPYKSGTGIRHTCEAGQTSVANITSWYQVSNAVAQEADIVAQLSKVGPVTIGIDATPMQSYSSGIDNPKSCGHTAYSLDHAVLIVGYGSENGVDYWKIKNSWGTSWGEKGYYRIVRGENKCGVAMDVVHSVV